MRPCPPTAATTAPPPRRHAVPRAPVLAALTALLLAAGGCGGGTAGSRDANPVGDGGTEGDAGGGGDGAGGLDGGGGDGGAAPDGAPAEDGGLPPVEVAWEASFNLLPRDQDGWSVLTPASDARIVYVSDSLGEDATGGTYGPSSPEVGADPFAPAGAVKPFKTITAALAAVRSGFPDWVLLRRGDTFTITAPIDAKSGRSLGERFVLSAYGSAATRPLVRTGTHDGLRFWKQIHHVAVTGLHFYAHERDPDSADFVGFDNVGTNQGFYSYADVGPTPNQSILIEDCVFDFYSNNVVQGTQPNADFIVRRSIITNNYSTSSHSQGLYTHDSSVLLEENLFDHNGWYKQSYVALNDQAEGQATYFNHDTYFTNTHQTIFRRNLFLRASSIGNKFTANPPGPSDEIMARQVLLDNNLYVEGEIGISAGGNDDYGTGQRFQEIVIANNVLLDVGRARPTNRSLGWGIDVIDWDGGRVTGNVFAHYGSGEVSNTYALNLLGHTRDVDVTGNVIHGIASGGAAVRIDGDPKSAVTFTGNELQLGGTQTRLIDTGYTAAGAFASNVYATDFTGAPFRIDGTGVDFAAWQAQVGDPGSLVQALAYPDPGRTVESYMASLGLPASLAAFVAEAKQQSRHAWRPQLTAAAINAYVRAGFGK
jgi:hypothetical protein